MFLYFHGENYETRYATSEDGIHFAYGGVAVEAKMFGEKNDQASYAHVFYHPIASRGTKYVMLLMLTDYTYHGPDPARDLLCPIGVAFSPDGRSWTARQEPMIMPRAGYNNLASPWLFPWRGKLYILYVANLASSPPYVPKSDILADEVDPEFTQTKYAGLVFSGKTIGPNNDRASDPCLIEEDGNLYLFMSNGTRLNQRIALAVADAGTKDNSAAPDKPKGGEE